MKGACIATDNQAFVEWAYSIVKDMGGLDVVFFDGDLFVKDGARRFTLFDHKGRGIEEVLPGHEEFENREFLYGMKWVCLAECRWDDLFCRIVKHLAENDASSFRIVDNSSKVLLPTEVDPATIYL